MKNIFYTIAILLISQIMHCQNFDFLKNSDTLYIAFKGKKSEKKLDIQTRITPNNFNEKSFQFNLKKRKLF